MWSCSAASRDSESLHHKDTKITKISLCPLRLCGESPRPANRELRGRPVDADGDVARGNRIRVAGFAHPHNDRVDARTIGEGNRETEAAIVRDGEVTAASIRILFANHFESAVSRLPGE